MIARDEGLAELVYEQADYRIVRPGRYVLCAETGERIDLADLRYWSAERNEAYASAEAAFARHRALRRKEK